MRFCTNRFGQFKSLRALSMDPYKHAVITSMRHISSPSNTTKLIKKKNVTVSITCEYVSL